MIPFQKRRGFVHAHIRLFHARWKRKIRPKGSRCCIEVCTRARPGLIMFIKMGLETATGVDDRSPCTAYLLHLLYGFPIEETRIKFRDNVDLTEEIKQARNTTLAVRCTWVAYISLGRIPMGAALSCLLSDKESLHVSRCCLSLGSVGPAADIPTARVPPLGASMSTRRLSRQRKNLTLPATTGETAGGQHPGARSLKERRRRDTCAFEEGRRHGQKKASWSGRRDETNSCKYSGQFPRGPRIN